MPALCVLLTITLPWVGGIVVWAIGEKHSKAQHPVAIGFALAAAIAASLQLPWITGEVVFSFPLGPIFGTITFIPDGLGVFLSMIATGVGSLSVIFSMDYMAGDKELGRYYSLVLLFIGAMAGLVLTGSLLALFFFWEITAFCSYALISFRNDERKAVSGGIKALIITQVGGIGLLIGALAIYSQINSYQIGDLLAQSTSLDPTILGFIAFTFLFAAAAKSAQVPLHTWLPDAMEAPTPVSALIHAATMVNAGVYLLIRFYPSFQAVPGWSESVVVIGLASALLGGIQACFSSDIKRVLAYSTISQLGYMVYAIGVGSIFASQFHLLNHSIFKALLFLGAGGVIHLVGTRNLFAMGALRERIPLIFRTFMVGALALAGIPFFNGFFSKELILEGGLKTGPSWAYIGMLVATGFTGLYVTRLLALVFYGKPAGSLPHRNRQSAIQVSLSILALGVLTSWILADRMSEMLLMSLPYHGWPPIESLELMRELLLAPGTWFALLTILLGASTWLAWGRWGKPSTHDWQVVRFIQTGFGFEQINRCIVRMVDYVSRVAQKTQTGQLQWNLSGIVIALLIGLSLVALGV